MAIEEQRLTDVLRSVQASIFRARQAPATLYHYTTSAGMQGIVTSASLRMTHTAYLNDASEIVYSRNIAIDITNEFCKENNIDDGIISELILHIQERESVVTTAISCFSDAENLLNQWRDYGGQQAYCIGFDGPRLLSDSRTAVRLVPMIYDFDDQRQILRSYLLQITEIYRSIAFQMALGAASKEEKSATLVLVAWSLMTLSSFFKHPSFAVEREWRLVWEGPFHSMHWEFSPSLYGLTPHFLRKFDVTDRLPLSSVMVGPCRFPDHTGLAIRTLLNQAGYDVPVAYSFIPVRV